MKDYEKIYKACQILEAQAAKHSTYNLNAAHDTLHLCFDVRPSNLTPEIVEELRALGVKYDNGTDTWYTNCSC